MTKLEQFNNTQIEAAPFEAPSGRAEVESFTLSRGHWMLFFFALVCIAFIAFITLARSVQVSAITPILVKPDTYSIQPAQIAIDTSLKLPLGNRVLLLPGKHSVTLQADGYQTLTHDLQVSKERHQQFELIMTRLPGSLKVSLQAELETTAQVTIDGQSVGELPGIIEGIAAGERQITIDAPLYRPVTTTMMIQGKGQVEEISVGLQPAWAEYSLSTLPEGATVNIDGQSMGETPLTLKLEEGLRSLAIKAAGFKLFEQEVGVVAEQNIAVPEIELIPADGELDITSTPGSAAVILNGEYRGVTPLKLTVAPNQSQTLQVYKAGYRLHQKELSLAPEQQVEQSIDLNQDLVSVRLSVSPSDAQVIVDGVNRGKGSQNLNLNTLPHKISVRKPGYVAYNTELIPTKGNKQIISVQLLTKDQHYWAQVPATYSNKFGHRMKLFRDLGKVEMGSSRREAGRRANEVQFTAELTKPFYVALHETTNKQFRAFKASHSAGNYKKKSLDANKAPAVNISWQNAAQYCNWLSKKEGLDPFYKTVKGVVSGNNLEANGYRLLTEAEWSWLARKKDGQNLLYPWGNTVKPTSARPVENLADVNAAELIAFTLDGYDDGYKGSAPVGRFDENHNGLFDIGGNASEWVNDWYSAKGSKVGSKTRAVKDPIGPEIGEFHVVRGASWAKGHLPQLRLAYRDYSAKGKHDIGFRIARYAGRTKGAQSAAGAE